MYHIPYLLFILIITTALPKSKIGYLIKRDRNLLLAIALVPNQPNLYIIGMVRFRQTLQQKPRIKHYYILKQTEDQQLMTANITQTADLAQVYSDVSSELCNKHVKRLSQLKTVFSDVYDDYQPQKYVIVNGVAKVIDIGNDLQLNFALQSGIIVSYSKIQKNSQIFINGNHLEEQLIFNAKGKHIEGIHEQIDQIKEVIQTIRKNSEHHKQFCGGILYVHSNIAQNLFGQRECFILAVTISLMLIHEELHRYNKEDILNILTKLSDKLSGRILSNLLNQYEISKCLIEYGHRNIECTKPSSPQDELQLNLSDPNSDKSIGTHESNQSIHFCSQFNVLKKLQSIETTASDNSISSLEETSETTKLDDKFARKIDMDHNKKLILCKLDLSRDQQIEYNNKNNKIKQISQLISHQSTPRFQILEEDQQTILEISTLKDITNEEHSNLVKYCQQSKLLLQKLMNQQFQFTQFLRLKHELDVYYQILDQQVVDLINQIQKQVHFLQDFCIIEGNTLLISQDKQHYAEIMYYLRQLIKNSRLSTNRFLSTRKTLGSDAENNFQIAEVMFTTSASLGCAVYTPSEDMWL